MINAKLFVRGIERELLRTDLEYHRALNHKTDQPGPIPMGELATFSFMFGYGDDILLRWMIRAKILRPVSNRLPCHENTRRSFVADADPRIRFVAFEHH